MSLTIRIIVVGVEIAIGLSLFMLIGRAIAWLRTKCIFGHPRKYVAAMPLEFEYYNGLGEAKYKTVGGISVLYSHVARWVCATEGCPKMGEHPIRGQGAWTVSFGKLVPDEKRWSNAPRA